MRGAPHVGFSATMRKIRSRTSLLTGFLPAACRVRDSQDQYNRKPARCQRITVSGVTSSSGFFHPDHSLRRATPEHLVDRAQSPPRSFGMESQQLLTQCQILQHEVRAGSKRADKPADEVPKQRNHGKNLSGRPLSGFVPSHSFHGPTEFWRTTTCCISFTRLERSDPR